MPPFNFNSLDRLRLGQGVAGGAKGLPPLGPPSPTPRPPANVPRVKIPAGFATDVTPSRPIASSARLPSTEGQGGALLARGSFKPVMPDTKLGKGELKTLKVLQSPDTLYNPRNSKQLNALVRPGPKLQAAIDSDPHLKQNHIALLQHIINHGPTKLPGQDLIKQLHNTVTTGKMDLADFSRAHSTEIAKMDPESAKRFAAAADVAQQAKFNTEQSAGFAAGALQSGPLGHVGDAAISQAFGIATGLVPGAYKTVTDPRGTLSAVGQQYSHLYGPLVHGDLGEFAHRVAQQPLSPVLDALAGAGTSISAASRVGRAGEVLGAVRDVTKVSKLPSGITKVGNMTIHRDKNGMYDIRQSGRMAVGKAFPDEKSAVHHAQTLQTAGVDSANMSPLMKALTTGMPRQGKAAVAGFVRGRKSLVDAYNESRGVTHDKENSQIIDEVAATLDNPNVTGGRRTFAQVKQQVKDDLSRTRAQGVSKPARIAESNLGHVPPALARQMAVWHTGLREALDLTRLGAIYLRPAYLPNNWAGNVFMNLVHQGPLAPINLAKSLVMDKYMDPRYARGIDTAMGQNPAEAGMHGIGYTRALSQPLIHTLGAFADQPFRRAAFLHEARRTGYYTLNDVQGLMKRFEAGDAKAQADVGNIARRAQEEVVKFGKLSDAEAGVAKNLIFVYSWMRGSSRYALRAPLEHPAQATIASNISQVGNQWTAATMGGVPHFMLGSIPVGRTKDGDPILINPFALNPLGSGVQVAQAIQGSIHALTNPADFNKYRDLTLIDLANPIAQGAIKSFTGGSGGKSLFQQMEPSIAPYKLVKDLMHPGRGSMFPMSREEALGHYIVGSLWPRHASQEAITSSLARENIGHPELLIPQQLKDYQKATGVKIPDNFIGAYRGDLTHLQDIKDFQRQYASDLGSTGYKKLPPINQAQAALKYLRDRKYIDDSAYDTYQKGLSAVTSDAAAKEYAAVFWGMTNAGIYKRAWDDLMRSSKVTKLTKAKK